MKEFDEIVLIEPFKYCVNINKISVLTQAASNSKYVKTLVQRHSQALLFTPQLSYNQSRTL